MPVLRTDHHRRYDAAGNLVADDAVQVDVTAERTQAAIVQSFIAAFDELAADRQAYIAAIQAVNEAKADVAAHVSRIEQIRDSTASPTLNNLGAAVKDIAAAMRDHFTASNRLANAQITLAQATEKIRLTLHRMAKLLLVMYGEERDAILADDPSDPLVVE